MINNTTFILAKEYFSNFNHSKLTNRTTLSPFTPPTNRLIALLTIAFAVMTIILNGLILSSFIRHPRLRTPFNCYVINLSTVDILSALFPMPQNIIRQLVGIWPSNGLACTTILFLSQTCNSANRAAHLLIAVNRFWAVTAPLSYRNRHTKNFAVGAVLFAWTSTLGFVTPEVVIGRRSANYSLSAADPSCVYDSSSYVAQVYHTVFTILVFDMPEVIILIAYPWLVFKLRQKTAKQVSTSPVKLSGNETLDSVTATASTSKAHIHEPKTAQGVKQKGATEHSRQLNSLTASFSRNPNASGQTKVPDDNQDMQSMARRYNHPSRSKGHNRLFVYLLLPVIVCWTPNHVYYLWSGFTGGRNATVATMQFFLSWMNSWLNPILIYLADSQVRKAANQLIKCR